LPIEKDSGPTFAPVDPTEAQSAAAVAETTAPAASAPPADNLSPNVVTMKLKLEGLDHTKCVAPPGEALSNLQIRVEKSLRQAIAKYTPGVDPAHIHLALSAGSVVVVATCVPPDGSSASLSKVKSALADRPAVEDAVLSAVKQTQGISDATTGSITCSSEDPFLDEWKEATAPDGQKYYYSVKTMTSNWHNPKEAVEEVQEVPEAPVEEAPPQYGSAPVVMDETDNMVLTFMTADKQPQEKTITFFEQPIGMVWIEDQMPIKVDTVRKKGFADTQGVKKKWVLYKVNGENVKDNISYKEAYDKLMTAVHKLPKKGDANSKSFA